MIKLNLKNCTACGACVQKCPKKCIELKSDVNGFLAPIVNNLECINCGMCNRVCPIDKTIIAELSSPIAYACANKNKGVMLQETSGGVFGVIADYVLGQGGVVYGCAYTEHLQASHVRINSKENLFTLFGSKYVQSHTRNTFEECEEDLKNGRLVLYSGTPCQIAGLKQYLQKNYENLITVDLVCHGVASQSYFDKFIGFLEKNVGLNCIDYNFRSKKNSGWSIAGIACFKDYKGNTLEKKQYYFSNYYYGYFLSCSIYRESCYSCKYANINRVGDFTLGDFWGVEGLSIPFDVENGCSLVLLNSVKATKIFDTLDLNKHIVSLDIATKYNRQLVAPSTSRYNRNELLREYREDDAALIQKKFKKRSRMQNLKGRIKYLLPKKLKRILLKLKYTK